MLRLIQFSVLLFNHPKYINLHRLADIFLDDHPDGGYLSVPYQKLFQLPLSVRILVGLMDGEPAYSDPASAAGAELSWTVLSTWMVGTVSIGLAWSNQP